MNLLHRRDESAMAAGKAVSEAQVRPVWRALAVSLGVTGALGSLLVAGHGRGVRGAMEPPAAITVDYPLNRTVYPPDMAPPTVLWRDAATNAVTWKIDVTFAGEGQALHVTSDGPHMQVGEIDPRCIGPTNKLPELTQEQAAAHTWKPDANTWDMVRKYAVENAATVMISGYAAKDAEQPVSRGEMQLTISKDPVGAPIFYRDVPLMPSANEKGVIKPLSQAAVPLIIWRMRNVGEEKSHIVMHDLHSCANCHSFSADGKTLGLDMDGPSNDKGLYAIVPVAEKMSIATSDMISWASFRKELDPQLRVGFMSQVSPDGRYVVTTVKPLHTSSAQFYYVQNFTDYRFLQVFYPTRGILAVYDRETKELKPLPGADNPDFVQACAVWSPDGKYLVFLHSKATDPNRADGMRAKYSNDPNEVQIQYDLYRIPFNGGKGGVAEPIEGAGQNGMSNSFAKVSPDGKWIVFVQAKNGLLIRPDSRLYIIPAAGGKPRLMKCNTSLMNSWHSWSPNGRWLVFSSKSLGPYTKMFLTHVDEEGNDSPAVLIEDSTAANRAVNIPEFVNMNPSGIEHIATPAIDFYKEYDLAVDLTNQGDYTAAIAQWNKTLSMVPDDPRAHNAYGSTLAKAGKPKEALEQFRIALEKNPQFADAHNNAGVLLASAGRQNEAATQFRAALEASPENAEAHVNLGRLMMDQSRVLDAIQQFQEAIESNPASAEAHNDLGTAYRSLQQQDKAIAEYKKAMESDAKFAHAYDNLGLVLAGRGDMDEAIANFNKAVEVDPRDGGAEAGLGRALLEKNQFDDAIAHLTKAAGLGPDSAEVETSLGLALGAKGNVEEAIPHFEQALKVAPGMVEAEYYLGESLIANGRGAEGLSHWREGLRTEPDNLLLLNQTAWLLATAPDANLRNGKEAVGMAQHAIDLSSGQRPEVLGTLAAAYAEAGQFDQAIATEERAEDLAKQQGKAALAGSLDKRLTKLRSNTPIRQ